MRILKAILLIALLIILIPFAIMAIPAFILITVIQLVADIETRKDFVPEQAIMQEPEKD